MILVHSKERSRLKASIVRDKKTAGHASQDVQQSSINQLPPFAPITINSIDDDDLPWLCSVCESKLYLLTVIS